MSKPTEASDWLFRFYFLEHSYPVFPSQGMPVDILHDTSYLVTILSCQLTFLEVLQFER